MRIGHYGLPALLAFGTAVVLLVVHLAVPFGVVDHPDAPNDTVGAGDIAADYDETSRSGLPSPGTTFTGILLALVAGLLLTVLGLVPMPVNTARFMGWGLAALGLVGAWLAFSSSAYWLGTGFATLLGVISGNAHEARRLWTVSPVLVAVGAAGMGLLFLRVATTVVSKRDGLRDDAVRNAKVAVAAGILLAVVLVVPWSFQLLDGDERRDNDECNATTVCKGRLDWYTAHGTSGGAVLHDFQFDVQTGFFGFGSLADGTYGGIIQIANTGEQVEFPVFTHAAFSIGVLTAASWVTFFVAVAATLGHVVASARPAPQEPSEEPPLPAAVKATTSLHILGLAFLAWGAVHLLLLLAYQWRPTYDDTLLDPAQSWWSGFLGIAAAPLLVLLGRDQLRIVRPAFQGIKRVAKEQAASAHSFD